MHSSRWLLHLLMHIEHVEEEQPTQEGHQPEYQEVFELVPEPSGRKILPQPLDWAPFLLLVSPYLMFPFNQYLLNIMLYVYMIMSLLTCLHAYLDSIKCHPYAHVFYCFTCLAMIHAWYEPCLVSHAPSFYVLWYLPFIMTHIMTHDTYFISILHWYIVLYLWEMIMMLNEMEMHMLNWDTWAEMAVFGGGMWLVGFAPPMSIKT